MYDSQPASIAKRNSSDVLGGAPAAEHQALANLCHELRTPLTVMNGYLEILSEDWGEQMHEAARGMVRRMRLNAVELSQTVDNLLEWVSGRAGDRDLLLESFTAGDLIAEVAPALDLIACRQELSLKWEMEHAPRAIRSDRRALRGILLNLVLNGLKFTHQGGVTVRMSTDVNAPARLRLEVCDTGIGIAPEQVARIFAPFTQLSDSAARRYRGLGLGLALVERNVRLLGGRIEVTSRLGAGSIFRIELPQAALA